MYADVIPRQLREFRRNLFDRMFPWFGAGVPDSLVYPFSLNLGRRFGRLFQHGEDSLPAFRDGCSRLIQLCLIEFAQLGKAFDVPMVVQGLDQVVATYARHRRLFLVSIHLPLNRCMHRALAPLRLSTCVITAASGKVPTYVCGIPDATGPRLLHPGPALYLQVRSALSQEQVVITDIDRWFRDRTVGLTSGPIEFAARTQTPVIFFATILDRNGDVRVVFSPPQEGTMLQNRSECLDSIAEFLRPFVGKNDRFSWETHPVRRRFGNALGRLHRQNEPPARR